MNYPRGWARLPGPADFLQTVAAFLMDGNSVIVGLPAGGPSDDIIAIEVAELIEREGGFRWDAIRAAEEVSVYPRKLVESRFGSDDAGNAILWVNAVSRDSASADWMEHARQFAQVDGSPRICITAMEDHVPARTGSALDTKLRLCLWTDFVTATDSRVLVERYARNFERTPEHVALKCALVATLAGSDLVIANTLSRCPLKHISNPTRHPPHCIWEAQVAILFPIIERERQNYLEIYRDFWQLPHKRRDGTTVQDADNLGIGDLLHQARQTKMLRRELPRLDWLLRVRNALAHSEIVAWDTLVSPVGIQVADFRD